jgi:hypothetical protein
VLDLGSVLSSSKATSVLKRCQHLVLHRSREAAHVRALLEDLCDLLRASAPT